VITPFASGAADSVQRRSPALIVDDNGALWIFWRELADNRWTLRYNRFSDADLPPSPVGAKAFPPDGSANPRVEADLSVSLLTPPAGGSGPRIWVTWSRREPLDGNGAGTRSWRLASRFKNSVDVAKLDDWSPVVELAGQSGAHDREPFAFQPKDGGPPRAYFSSTRDGSWSIWRSTMDLASHQWAAPTAVTSPPYSDRAPAAFYGPDGAEVLAFRSARPVTYPSAQYSSTVTSDVRYCGSSTLRSGNAGQLALMGGPADFTSYFAFAGQPGDRTDADLIAGDTLGIYVNTGDDDKEALANRGGRLLDVIGEFLPATTRVVVMSYQEGTV
jgi:hypothetical protein